MTSVGIEQLEGQGAWDRAGFVFLTNRDGEDNADASEPAMPWEYELLAECEGTCCVVQLPDRNRGLLFCEELVHSSCDDGPGGEADGIGSEQDTWDLTLAMAQRLRECGFRRVFAGRRTGPCGRHQIAAYVPFEGPMPDEELTVEEVRDLTAQWLRELGATATAASGTPEYATRRLCVDLSDQGDDGGRDFGRELQGALRKAGISYGHLYVDARFQDGSLHVILAGTAASGADVWSALSGVGFEVAAVGVEAEPRRPRCRFCGYTDDRARERGCYWVESDLCSRCMAHGLAERRSAITWLSGGDTGLSSACLCAVMAGVKPRQIHHPVDPADLGRCIRLLDQVPYWRPRLYEMAKVSPSWAAVIAGWNERESLYRAEAASGTTSQCSARMQEVLASAVTRPAAAQDVAGGA